MSFVSSLCAFVVLELEAATRHPEMSLAEFGVELGSRLERRLGFFEFLARLEREAGVELSRCVFRLELEQLTVEFRCFGEIRPLEVDLGRNGVDLNEVGAVFASLFQVLQRFVELASQVMADGGGIGISSRTAVLLARLLFLRSHVGLLLLDAQGRLGPVLL